MRCPICGNGIREGEIIHFEWLEPTKVHPKGCWFIEHFQSSTHRQQDDAICIEADSEGHFEVERGKEVNCGLHGVHGYYPEGQCPQCLTGEPKS